MYSNIELRPEEKLITVSYDTLTKLLEREEYMTNRLKEQLSSTEQYISNSYISLDEDKWYLNFVLTPNWIK